MVCGLALGMAAAQSAAQQAAPTAADWKTHLTDELLSFWSAPGAAGTPPGAFPGRLCNDGTVPVSGTSCSGVPRWMDAESRTLVAHSRQVFSYAIAFHMTGDTAWLDLAEAGLEDQFATF